jgi:pyruvate/2-oxoglutarate/acetoin dehydrogenase E1 component
MRRDPKIFYMSTDAAAAAQEFGDQRIRATPITEAALTGSNRSARPAPASARSSTGR